MTETARGFHWSEPLFDDKTLDAYARKSGLDATLSALLLRREVPPEEVEAFLHPTLRNLFPDPSSLKDMDVATELIAKAILEKKDKSKAEHGQKEGEKFQPHTMYDKQGKAYQAKTYSDHLKYKKMGYTNEKPSESGYKSKKKYKK